MGKAISLDEIFYPVAHQYTFLCIHQNYDNFQQAYFLVRHNPLYVSLFQEKNLTHPKIL